MPNLHTLNLHRACSNNIIISCVSFLHEDKKHSIKCKKHADQEPPYLRREICVLQWEEIKTKNSGATHHF